ncbi:MAG: GHKL domain-containing protein [Hydrogenophilales bacterium]|nr:GHKL domain-containing protein [Hydrogenophilales bacterium]
MSAPRGRLSPVRKWLANFSPLGWRLVAATVALSTVIALLATAFQLYIDYRRDLRQIEATFEQVDKSYLPTISNAVWATNRLELQIALNGLVHLPDVRYVAVKENGKTGAEAGHPKAQNIRSRDFPLTRVHRGETLTLGGLTVVVDMAGVHQRLLEKFWMILITNGVNIFLVAGFMLWLFHWLVTRHLYHIAEFASRLGPGNLGERLVLARPARPDAKPDEFDWVLEGFNRMQTNLIAALQALEQDIVKLERAEAEIYQLNTALEQRVADRTAQLEAVNRELEAFSYSVSHDLRTPLRSIDGFSQALIEDYGERLDAQALDYLNRVRRTAQRMGMLIDDLLRLSRVTRANMTHARIDLSALAEEVMADLRKHKGAGAVTLTVQPGLAAYGDPALLRIVLENLLDNAWKYSSKIPEPRIELGSLVQDGRLVFFVRDNGAGFDMTYVDKLFGAFQRLHREDDFPGTGVGLATVKRIVHRHGGEVWAEGRLGGGAVFYFTLGGLAGTKP